ncbi:MAG: hypothetical protein HY689_05215 [Chloroflexi bacterium]|nr:hypothetical protein [Chloroflexota bacterium]
MTCFPCGEPISGPAVPRPQAHADRPVYLHPECWERCCRCGAPLHVFEPVGVFRGTPMPLVFRDSGRRAVVQVDGVWANACQDCAAVDRDREAAGEV